MKRLLRARVLLTLATAWPAAACADAGRLPLSMWVEEWRVGTEQVILITLTDDGELEVDGYATYGAADPERVANGSVQVGCFTVRLSESWINDDNEVAFAVGENGPLPYSEGEDIDCKVRMRLDQPSLIVNDNGRCGGANVSFTGVYGRLPVR